MIQMLYFLQEKLKLFLKRHCRPYYCIWYGQRKDTWRKTRYLSSAVAGALCAYMLSNILFASIIFPQKCEKRFLYFFIAISSIGFVFCDSYKCVVYLMFVALMGKSGRSFLRALCFAFIIAGPIENLSSNAGEIVRVLSCSKLLTYNLTRTRFDLMTKPFQRTLSHMKDDIKEVRKTFNEFKNVTQDVHSEILDDDPVLSDQDIEIISNDASKIFSQFIKRKRHSINHRSADYTAEEIQQRYKQKFRKRCKLQLDSGKARCRKAFFNALQNCRARMPPIVRTLLCWPLKIDFVCNINILGDPDKICDPSEAIPDDFGKTYVELVDTENSLNGNNSDVKVKYNIARPESLPELESAKETAKSIKKEFDMKNRFLNSILLVLKQILAFMIIRIIFACKSYHKRYNAEIDHDNIYISGYFKRIDQTRKANGKSSLLPLKKYEKRNLIDVDNIFHRTREESRAVAYHLLQFSLESVTAAFFLFLDYVFVSILLIIRKNSKMSFVQEGEHTIHFSIQGSGLIARLLRTTLKNFEMNETVSTYMTNEPCLPNPSALPTSFYLKFFALYMAVIILIYQSATFLRMRRLICGYFYRKREKKRIIYLYNSILKQRRSMRESMLKQVKYNFANRQIRLKLNLFLKLRLKYPQHFGWLMRFNVARRKCVICDEYEDEKFTICENPNCGVSYCENCWLDMDNTCLVCNDIVSINMIMNFNDFFEEFSFV